MFHAIEENIERTRSSPLLEKIMSCQSKFSSERLECLKEDGELGNFGIPKLLMDDASYESTISSDVKNGLSHFSNLNIRIKELTKMEVEDFKVSCGHILKSSEPAPLGDNPEENKLSTWKKIKKQFKRIKDALTCSSQDDVKCIDSAITGIQVPSSLSTSKAPVSPDDSESDFTDSNSTLTRDESQIKNCGQIETEMKTEKNEDGYHEIHRVCSEKPESSSADIMASSVGKSSKEITSLMEGSLPNLPSVSSVAKYWDDHPISLSCRNIFSASKPTLDETIIQTELMSLKRAETKKKRTSFPKFTFRV